MLGDGAVSPLVAVAGGDTPRPPCFGMGLQALLGPSSCCSEQREPCGTSLLRDPCLLLGERCSCFLQDLGPARQCPPRHGPCWDQSRAPGMGERVPSRRAARRLQRTWLSTRAYFGPMLQQQRRLF